MLNLQEFQVQLRLLYESKVLQRHTGTRSLKYDQQKQVILVQCALQGGLTAQFAVSYNETFQEPQLSFRLFDPAGSVSFDLDTVQWPTWFVITLDTAPWDPETPWFTVGCCDTEQVIGTGGEYLNKWISTYLTSWTA
ncbi:uncharacterized protein KNAG_0E01090 [Huiozyma naganishii CBS 8797]|uniref:Uncharacterized protein n=1 Tax=Huiozyma naganishii (strain ATCC MYA-139 / BCRC 22969 / CBS 8797 / KCTC 17520 / NBRC 10181 / NCYC 3082 / Yp74L-3) TaxID=1071383 RepID=J7S7J7_HUIN7|nr:hypothetical protein KNAG_0E01090 [Kazachstania naganishii CBS 8797]CCK70376.1 hypothetical protein KNAG_0E01090 [Kazachstania naganishii CBS 8797]